MSQAFDATTSSDSNAHALTNDTTSYHPAFSGLAMLPGLNSFIQSLSTQSQASQSAPSQQYSTQSHPATPSSSNSDIEKLERLKKEILEDQNPIYKAVPQPNFLESLYLGRSVQSQISAPAHPDQVVKDSSPSGSPQTAPPISPTSEAKTDDSEHVSEDHDEEKLKGGTQSAHDISSDDEQNVNVDPGPGHAVGDAHPPRSSALRAELESSESEQKHSNPPEQHSSHASSIGAVDAASLAHLIPGQAAAVPGTQNMGILTATGSIASSHSPQSKSVLESDPPYDPKESLRFLDGGSIWSDQRYRQGAAPYDSKESNIQYGLDESRGTAQQKDGNWAGRREDQSNERPGEFWDKHVQEAHASEDLGLPVSRFSNDALRAAEEFPFREFQSIGKPTHPIIVQSAGAGDTASTRNGHTAMVSPSLAAGGTHIRAYSHPVDGKSRLYDHSSIHSTAGPLQSFPNDDPSAQVIEAGASSFLEGPKGNAAPSIPRDGTGVRIPLEERISSPVNASSHVTHSSYLGDSQNLRHTIAGKRASREPSRTPDVKPIPTPLSLVRQRPTDGKVGPVSPPFSSRVSRPLPQDGQGQHSRAASGDFVKSFDKPWYSVRDDISQIPVRGSPQDPHDVLSTPPGITPDTKLTGSPAAYRGDGHRPDGRKPYADIAHYERPAFQERDAPAFEGRTGPANRGRGWRGRGAYPRSYQPRSDAHPPSGNPPRFWTGNARGRHSGAPFVENRDKFPNRESERRPPPRSWDREETDYTRPPHEVYPPPEDLDRERYPPAELHERPRIRGRSPSPAQRAPYGGPVTDFRPSKRVREEPYYDDHERRYTDYQAHQVSSPPDGYYATRDPYAPRDSNNGYYDPDVPYYDRRASDMGPPPSPPPYSGRVVYSRPDIGRYNGAPPRTA